MPAATLEAAITHLTKMVEAAEAADIDDAHDAVIVDEETGETL
jgi:hypothetical protein